MLDSWGRTGLHFNRAVARSTLCIWHMVADNKLRFMSMEAALKSEISQLIAASDTAQAVIVELQNALETQRARAKEAEQQSEVLSQHLHEAVKTKAIAVSELSASCQNAMQTAAHLKADNKLKNDALARTRQEADRAVEGMVLKHKEAARSQRVEKRLEGLYVEAVTALESEQEASQELVSGCLRLHRATLKVFTALEDHVKRIKLGGARDGTSDGAPDGADEDAGLPGHVQDRAGLMRWDERMLQQVYRWLNIHVKSGMAAASQCIAGAAVKGSSFQLYTPPVYPTARVTRPASPSLTNPYTPLPALRETARPRSHEEASRARCETLPSKRLVEKEKELNNQGPRQTELRVIPGLRADIQTPHQGIDLSPWKDTPHKEQ